MKENSKFLYLLIILIVVGAGAYFYQNNPKGIVNDQSMFGATANGLTTFQKEIVNHWSEGDVPNLVASFDEEVSLSILGEDDFYTKEEAESLLVEFFKVHSPKSFSVKHQGSNRNKTGYYFIGEMRTTTQKTFRVYISNNTKKIENIEVSTQKDI